MNVQPVILSGGSGTRLWPASRESYPKQLLRLLGERSMLQETLLRLQGIADNDLLVRLLRSIAQEHSENEPPDRGHEAAEK